MLTLLSMAFAFEPHIGGGMGGGVFAPTSNLLRLGGGVTGSAEVTELIEPIPWLGVGVDSMIGFYPKQCDTCVGYPVFRLGVGPVFRSKRGMLQAGARYSVGTVSLPRQMKLRPYIRSSAVLPAGPLDFRLTIWVEGLPIQAEVPMEAGLALELGWWLDKGQFMVSRDAKKRPPRTPPPSVEPIAEPPADAQPPVDAEPAEPPKELP